MTKKIISVGLAVSAALMMSGCSSVEEMIEDKFGDGGDIEKGTAFYIDSAVKGVRYVCGTETGRTLDNGQFSFEVGAGCTFYLENMKLRDVDASLLKDGQNLYEDNVTVAQVLMTLDVDANPDNGLYLSPTIISKLEAAGIDSLPSNEAEMEAFMQLAEEHDGTPVAADDAQAHLDQVKEEAEAGGTFPAVTVDDPGYTDTEGVVNMETMVIGRTLYIACGSDVDMMNFGADGVIHGTEQGESYEMNYRTKGDMLYTLEPEDGTEDAHRLSFYQENYSVTFTEEDGSRTHFYYSSEDALAHPQSGYCN